MKGLPFIGQLAKMSLKSHNQEATPYVEALIRLAEEEGDVKSAKKLAAILEDARKRGFVGSNSSSSPGDRYPMTTSSATMEMPVSISKFLEDSLPAPPERPTLDASVSQGIRDYIFHASHGLKENIFFVGPSGTGKTLTAAWLAAQLEKPLYRLAYPRVFDSYLGRTARNLVAAFEEVKLLGGILFIDEVDAILRSRELTGDHGEMQRTVNVLLMEIDRARDELPIFAATNLFHKVDTAVARRFHLILHFNLPSDFLREHYVRLKVKQYIPSYLMTSLIRLTEGFSYADLEKLLGCMPDFDLPPTAFWPEFLRVLSQTSPPATAQSISEFAHSPSPIQARKLIEWGVEKQVVTQMFGISSALLTKWIQGEKLEVVHG
ncbi:MAG: hypothetical protein A3G34_10730 [Candidatus Lindowbacteria bacterium RIFCSPLOWO2_12_FULL_62_27]|nr:MAG: hypothetical protein A3G34_10730 [Candidatus Lindowbacteria bacterium RIFCSPLOWO2_12_FULL_62_27]